MCRSLIAIAASLAVTACYHVQIDTGAPVTQEVYHDDWAGSFVFGLIGPNDYELADRCPNGVAQLDVQHSAANVFVSILTVGLYTPVSIAATCANGPVHVPTADEMRRREQERGRGGQDGRAGGRGAGGRGGRGGRSPDDVDG